MGGGGMITKAIPPGKILGGYIPTRIYAYGIVRWCHCQLTSTGNRCSLAQEYSGKFWIIWVNYSWVPLVSWAFLQDNMATHIQRKCNKSWRSFGFSVDPALELLSLFILHHNCLVVPIYNINYFLLQFTHSITPCQFKIKVTFMWHHNTVKVRSNYTANCVALLRCTALHCSHSCDCGVVWTNLNMAISVQ